ncbi:ash family protein, partial [Salmonella enterica]|nr:ash family protein [Salmonella enterica]
MQRQLKKSLNAVIAGCYIALTITVLMVGRCNPEYTQATLSALSAFFIVATLFALVPFYGLVRRLSLDSKGFKITTGVSGSHVMVAQAGQLSGWPGSCVTGIATPVWAIASERCNSSDSFETIHRRLPQWLQPQPQNTQNPRSPNSVTTVAVSVGVRVKNAVKNHCADLILRDIVSLLLQIQQPGFASRLQIRCQNTHLKRVFCCLMSHVQWRHGRELLRGRRVYPYLPVMRIPFVLPPMVSHPLMVVKNLQIRRLPQWLRPQPQNTQNPRSPNSVTTVAVSFIAHRWWYFICT